MFRLALLLAIFGAAAQLASAQACGNLNALAVQGYIYGFPLVSMNYTRLLFLRTNPKTKINQFAHMRDLPFASDAAIVRPDTDALYSGAFLNLTLGPQLLEVAGTKGDPFIVQIIDAWTNVRARTKGTKPQSFSIFGPNWKDTSKAKKGSIIVRMPTNMAWIYGRVPVKKEDLNAARRIQNGFTLKQLAGRPSTESAGIDPLKGVPSVRDYMITLEGGGFYRKMAELLCQNPALPGDKALVQRLQKCLGLRPCTPWIAPNAAAKKAVDNAAFVGLPLVDAYKLTPVYNNWKMGINSLIGNFGTDYRLRAYIVATAIGSNLPKDAILATTCVDSTGRPLDGSSAYKLRFSQAPPASMYWAVSMYDTEGLLLDNKARKYSVSSLSGQLIKINNAYEIYFQPNAPSSIVARNWIPSPPAQPYCLTIRLYGPSEDARLGYWEPPKVVRSNPVS